MADVEPGRGRVDRRDRRRQRWRRRRGTLLVLAVAFLLPLVAFAGLRWSEHRRDDARTDLARAEVALERAHDRHEQAEDRLAITRRAVEEILPSVEPVLPAAEAVVALDRWDVAAIAEAVRAGVEGNVARYNAAVAARNERIAEHDAAVEALRVQVNELLAVLALFRG